jgi:hypothetical protein
MQWMLQARLYSILEALSYFTFPSPHSFFLSLLRMSIPSTGSLLTRYNFQPQIPYSVRGSGGQRRSA